MKMNKSIIIINIKINFSFICHSFGPILSVTIYIQYTYIVFNTFLN